MTLREHARGLIAAVLWPLAMAAAAEPPAAFPTVGPPSMSIETSTPRARAPQAAGQYALRRQGQPSSQDRMQVLVNGLKLTPAQQAEVRQALEAQRAAIRRLSSAPQSPEVPRVAAIRAITRRTAERIRAVLNDDQRKLYSQPLPDDYSPSQGKPGVDVWLNAMRQKGK